jgi:phosphoglucosamine mutase
MTTTRLFGTDGVRGVANRGLTAELALALGRAVTRLLAAGIERPAVLVGRDTRVSGDMLEAAMVAGICSAGGEAHLLGVVSTPAVAYLTRESKAAAGVMISASHNPIADNGIKFFAGNGYKLDDQTEDRLAELALGPHRGDGPPPPVGTDIGRAHDRPDLVEHYVTHALSLIPEDLRAGIADLGIVVDCAHGSGSAFAPPILARLGATVWAMNDAGDGTKINVACGSTAPEAMAAEVLRRGADLGMALDGDADRVILADETGQIRDGDAIMAVCGLDLLERGLLPHRTVAGTVMSNFGLELALRRRGASLWRTKVGDRYVLEALIERGWVYGGEPSGHIIDLRTGTTGDGLLTALRVIEVMLRKGRRLSHLAAVVEKVPQELLEVATGRLNIDGNEDVRRAVQAAEARLAGQGRVVVRASGTQPVVRVMVEGPDQDLVSSLARELAGAVERAMR